MVERLALSAWVGFWGQQASQGGAQGLAGGGIVVHDQDVRKRVTYGARTPFSSPADRPAAPRGEAARLCALPP